MKYTIGDVIYPIGGTFETKNLRCSQLFIMGEGHSSVKINGEKFETPTGSVYMMYPETHYFIQFSTERESTHYWIALRELGSMKEKLKLLKKQMFLFHHVDVFLKYTELCLLSRDHYLFQSSCLPLITQFFDTYIDYCLNENVDKQTRNHKVLQAIQLMKRNLNNNLTLDEMANHVNCTREHLIRLFQQADLPSPMKYLKTLRLEKAYYLIKETDLLFKEIAQQVNICDSFQFSKEIKKHFKQTPKELRQAKSK